MTLGKLIDILNQHHYGVNQVPLDAKVVVSPRSPRAEGLSKILWFQDRIVIHTKMDDEEEEGEEKNG